MIRSGPVLSVAAAEQQGYALTLNEAVAQLTINKGDVLALLHLPGTDPRHLNGVRLGDRTRSWRVRQSDLDELRTRLSTPKPLPLDAITHSEAVAILAGMRLRGGTTEYNWWSDQLRAADRDEGLTRYTFRGTRSAYATRYSRAEVEALKLRLAEEGITGPSPNRSRLIRARARAAQGLLTASEYAEIAGVDVNTVCGWASDDATKDDAVEWAIKLRGRWYIDPEKAPRARGRARSLQVERPCSGECGRLLTLSAADLHRARRHYCKECDPEGDRARRESITDARRAWSELDPDEKRKRLSEGNRRSYEEGRRDAAKQTRPMREAAQKVLRELWKDREFRARWLHKRHKKTSGFGALGGRPRRSALDDEPVIVEDIRALRAQGRSAQNIADIVSARHGVRITRKMVRYQLNR